MSPPHLSRLRVQKYCCKTYNPNISPTFFSTIFYFVWLSMIYKYAFSSLQILSLRSFGLTLKNQKLKVTLRRLQILFAPLKSRQLALRAQTAGISLRSAHNLLYAFFVRSVLSLSCLPFFPLIFLPLILNFQFSKSRRVFIISRRLFSKRRRLFLFLCLSFQIK